MLLRCGRRSSPDFRRTCHGQTRQPARPGNRLRYLAEAVEPRRGRLGPQRVEQLVAALALCVGVESLIVTRDICNLDQADAERLKQWAANALLQQSIRDAAACL
jgi:hypothetical protein